MPGKVKGLFKWCRKVTDGYEGVELTNMTSDWKNGMALCALINRFRPDLIDFYSLSPVNVYFNNDLAFTVAERELGIPKYLDPVDMVTMESPDRLSMATYLAEFYEHFQDKYMYDPPEMPSGWPGFVPVLPKPKLGSTTEYTNGDKSKEQKYDIYDKEKQSKPLIEGESNAERTEHKEKKILNINKGSEHGDDLNHDIDDLYKDNLEILKTENSDVVSFNEACKKEIQDIKTAKKGAVLQAVVCAGITAVAATTVGDDTESYDSDVKGRSDERPLDVSDLGAIESEKIEDDVHADKMSEPETVENDDVCEYSNETATRPDLSRSDSGFGTANTEVLRETMKNLKLEENQIQNDTDSSNKEDTLEIPSDADTCTLKTVELLNNELNKGDIQIVDVNVIESKSTDNSDSEIHSLESEFIKENEQRINEEASSPSSFKTANVNEYSDSSSPDNEKDTEMGKHLLEESNSHGFASNKVTDIEVEEMLKESSSSSSSSSDSEANAEESVVTELVKNMKEQSDSNSSSDNESNVKHVENVIDHSVSKKSASDKESDVEHIESIKEYSDSSSSSSNGESVENLKEHIDSQSPTFNNDLNIECIQKTKEHSDNDSSTSGKEINVELDENMKEFSSRSTSSSDSEANAEESFASELVENIFLKVKSNPELIAEITKELPSIVKEVESGLEMESDNTYIYEPEYEIEIPKNIDVEIKIIPDEMQINVLKEVEISSHVNKDNTETKQEIEEIEQNPQEYSSAQTVLYSESSKNEDLGKAEDSLQDGFKNEPSNILDNDTIEPGLQKDNSSNVYTSEGSSSSSSSDAEVDESKTKATSVELKCEEPEREQGFDTEEVRQKSVEESKQKPVSIAISHSSSSSSSSSPKSDSDDEIDTNVNEESLETEGKIAHILPEVVPCEEKGSLSINLDKEEIQTVLASNKTIPEECQLAEDEGDTTESQESIRTSLRLESSSSSSQSSDEGEDTEFENQIQAGISENSIEVSPNTEISITLENSSEHLRKSSVSSDHSKSTSNSDSEGEPPALPVVGPPKFLEKQKSDMSDEELNTKPIERVTSEERFNLIDEVTIDTNVPLELQVTEQTETSFASSEQKENPADSERKFSSSTASSQSEEEDKTSQSKEEYKMNDDAVIDDTNKVILNEPLDMDAAICEESEERKNLNFLPDLHEEESERQIEAQESDSQAELQLLQTSVAEDVCVPEAITEDNDKANVDESSTSSSSSSSESDEEENALIKADSAGLPFKVESEVKDDLKKKDSSEGLQLSPELKSKDILQAELVRTDEHKNPIEKSSSSSSSSESEAEVETKTNTIDIDDFAPPLEIMDQVDSEQPEVQETVAIKVLHNLSTEVKPEHNVESPVFPSLEEETKTITLDKSRVKTNNIMKEMNEEEEIFAKPAIPDVKLEWSSKADDHKETPQQPKQTENELSKERECGKAKRFASVDTDLMKKAALMSKKMAQSITAKMEDQKKLGSDLSDKEDAHLKTEETLGSTPPNTPGVEDRKARKLAMFRQLQFSTRPTKKKFDDTQEAEGSSDSDSGFRNKLQMFSRKSSTNTEPERSKLVHSPSGNVHRKKISSPFLQSPTSPVSDDLKHMKKLHDCLPENPAPGSVAEYIRKISQSSLPKPQDEAISPVELSVEKQNVGHLESSLADNISPLVKVNLAEKNEEKMRVYVNPASIFAGRPVTRRHTLQDKKLAVRPVSIELRYNEENKEGNKDLDKPPIPPPRFHRKKLGKLNVDIEPLEAKPGFSNKAGTDIGANLNDSQKEKDIHGLKRSGSFNDKIPVEVKSLEKQPTLSDEERQEEEKQNELKRQESLKRRQSPRRSLTMSSPTRADSADGERVRNIWQEPVKKPPSPKIKRCDSFEVKIRPVSQQLTPEEKENAKKEKELERSNSFNSNHSSRPPTPTKNNQKLPVVVKPLSAQNSLEKKSENSDEAESGKNALPNKSEDSSENDVSNEAKVIEKRPPSGKKKSSILSIVEKMAHPKLKDSNEKPLIVDEVFAAKTVKGIEASPGKGIVSSVQLNQANEVTPVTKRPGSKILQYVQSCKEKSTAPKTLQDKVDQNRRSQSFTGTDKVKPCAEAKNASDLKSGDAEKEKDTLEFCSKVEQPNNNVIGQNKISDDKKPSKFKEEQEEAIRKCNSIFGLVKARIRPLDNGRDEELANMAVGNSQSLPLKTDKVVKETVKGVSEKKGSSSTSSSSSSSSQESSPSSTPKQSRKEGHKDSDNVNTISLDCNMLEKTDITGLGTGDIEKVKLPEITGNESEANEKDLVVIQKKKTEKSLEDTSSESDDDDEEILEDKAKTVNSSPSSQSSAEIQKEDLKEGLKTIIKDLEKDMKSDEEIEGNHELKENDTEEKPFDHFSTSQKEVDEGDGMTSKEMKDISQGEDVDIAENAHLEIKPVTKVLEDESGSKSNSSSEEDDKKLIKNEYKKLLHEGSLDSSSMVANDKAESENDLKDTETCNVSNDENKAVLQDVLGDNDKDQQDSMNYAIDHKTEKKNTSDNNDDSLKSEDSEQDSVRKKQKKKKKKKRNESVTSSSSESSQTDSDKDDDSNDKGSSVNDTSAGEDKTNLERNQDAGGQNKDRDRKSSTGSNKSSQSGDSKDAHVISIDIPGENAVIIQNDTSCSLSSKSESHKGSISSSSESEIEKHNQGCKEKPSVTGPIEISTDGSTSSQYILPTISLKVEAKLEDKDYHADGEHSDSDEENIRETVQNLNENKGDDMVSPGNQRNDVIDEVVSDTLPVFDLTNMDASKVIVEYVETSKKSTSTSDSDSSHCRSLKHQADEKYAHSVEKDSKVSLDESDNNEEKFIPDKPDASFYTSSNIKDHMKKISVHSLSSSDELGEIEKEDNKLVEDTNVFVTPADVSLVLEKQNTSQRTRSSSSSSSDSSKSSDVDIDNADIDDDMELRTQGNVEVTAEEDIENVAKDIITLSPEFTDGDSVKIVVENEGEKANGDGSFSDTLEGDKDNADEFNTYKIVHVCNIELNAPAPVLVNDQEIQNRVSYSSGESAEKFMDIGVDVIREDMKGDTSSSSSEVSESDELHTKIDHDIKLDVTELDDKMETNMKDLSHNVDKDDMDIPEELHDITGEVNKPEIVLSDKMIQAERKMSSSSDSSEVKKTDVKSEAEESDEVTDKEERRYSSSSSSSEGESCPKDSMTDIKADVQPVNAEHCTDIPKDTTVKDVEVIQDTRDDTENRIDYIKKTRSLSNSSSDDIDNDLKSNARDVNPQIFDKIKKEKTLSSSSSDSSSSNSSTDEIEIEMPVSGLEAETRTADHEVEDDELLKSVIEDAEPFRAPLLEDVIKSGSLEDTSEIEESIEDNKSDEEGSANIDVNIRAYASSNESSETDSSDDLYSDSRSKPVQPQYLLPECNKILTEFEGLRKEENLYLPENELRAAPVDVQVFVIPDVPVDKLLYPSLKDPEILIRDDYDKVKDVVEVNEEVIIPVEPVLISALENEPKLSESPIVAEIENQDDSVVRGSVEISDIVLEPYEETKHVIVSESEDELLKNIILENEMNLTNIEKRKSSTSSFSSTDDTCICLDVEEECDSEKELNKNDKHEHFISKESELKADTEIAIVNDIPKGKYVPYENVVIIKKPDSNFEKSTELIVKDTGITKNSSASSDNDNKDDSTWKSKIRKRTSSNSSDSSIDSNAIGLNVNEIESEILGGIKTRSRSDSSSSSSSSSTSTDSKSDDQKQPEAELESEFLIGREKDPSKSEVARLIQQSLEIDRRREELRKQEQDRLKVAQELHDQFKPRDEILEHEHIRHLSEASSRDSRAEENVDLDESSAEDEAEEQEAEISEELLAGEATPLSMPSAADSDTTDSSPDEPVSKPVVEVFDLQESSPDDISPDMESQALFVKLKEAQCKNAVLEAEITKLKAKLVVLENNEAQKKQYEKKNEEMASRLREMEKSLTNARKEINHYQDMMEGSQGQYIALEKKLKAEYTALEKKYHKAKKLIKEYQQREKDFIAERESLLQQQSEKDQQYDALVKSLKDRIFHLEGELGTAQKAAGLPVLLPPQDQAHAIEPTVVPSISLAVKSAPKIHDSGSPVLSPLADRDSISSESDISAAEPHSTSPAIDTKVHPESAITFESIPTPKLLDTSVNRAKAQLAANSPRRPPTKQRSKSQDSEDMIEAISENKPESGLETWIKHDSDNTVKKSDVRKRKAQQNDSQLPPPVSETPPIIAEAQPKIAEAPPPVESVPSPLPPSAGPNELLDQSDDMETARDRCNSESGESSSTLSQTSYDPSRPTFRNKDSEIPGLDTVSTDTTGTNDTAETSESSSSATAANKRSKGLLPKLPFKFGGSDRDKGGGVMLVSQRSLGSDDPAPAGDGGITLISKKKFDTGLDFDGASTVSDSSSGYMVGEMEQTSYSFSGTPANEDHPSQPGHHTLNQFSSGQITEWNNENVRHWLIGIEMEKYAPLFTDKSVTGPQLVAMDSNKLKALGVANAKDRDYLKKKVKELKLVLEKERKQMDRERKQMEKEQKQREKEQKKLSKKK